MPIYEQIAALNNYEVVELDNLNTDQLIDLVVDSWFTEEF